MERARLRWLVAGCATLAAISLLAPSAPSYDPWSWLIWGREIAGGKLDTRGGPAWKPLPVAVAAVLSPAGDAAPALWLVVARTSALLAAALAWRLAARLGAGGVGGAAAASGVLLTAGWVRVSAAGGSEGLLLALALLAADRHLAGQDRDAAAAWVRAGARGRVRLLEPLSRKGSAGRGAARRRQALAWGALAALVRVEVWPFLAVYALWLARRDRVVWGWVAAVAVVVPAAWFLPELAGSGDLMRSSARARLVEPGAPALAAVPFLASLRDAVALPFAPLLAGCVLAVVARARRELPGAALAPLAAGACWCAVVAAMSEAGYSGEARYALPGAAVLAVTGACGLAWGWRALRSGLRARPAALAGAASVVVAACIPAVCARAVGLAEDGRALADSARLSRDLDEALTAAGGRTALMRCGRPYVGPRRGPLLAWHLRVHKARVGFAPRAPGVVFRSALREGRSVTPPTPRGFAVRARAGRWTVLARCRDTARADA